MPGCSALGCNNRSEKGHIMKCFPRNPILRNIWKKKVGRTNWEPSNNSFLCHVHFDDSQFVTSEKIKLKKNAIPTIFNVTSVRKSPKNRIKTIIRPIIDIEMDETLIEYLDSNNSPVVYKAQVIFYFLF